MRFRDVRTRAFSLGLIVGLVASCTAALVVGARNRHTFRKLVGSPAARRDAKVIPPYPVIDGVAPLDPIALSVRPPEEVSPPSVRLESEMEDPPPLSQRW